MSGDLRAAVEGLTPDHEADEHLPNSWYFDGFEEAQDKALALIPEGAVLVTEDTLAAAITATHWYEASSKDALHEAAAILRHLREGT